MSCADTKHRGTNCRPQDFFDEQLVAAVRRRETGANVHSLEEEIERYYGFSLGRTITLRLFRSCANAQSCQRRLQTIASGRAKTVDEAYDILALDAIRRHTPEYIKEHKLEAMQAELETKYEKKTVS